MSQATGANVVFGFGEQTDPYTIPGTPDGRRVYLNKFGIKKVQNQDQSNLLTSSRGKAKPMLGTITDDGSFDFDLNAENTGLFFKHLFGNVVHSGTGPYTHVYTGGTLPVSLWADVDYGAAFGGDRYTRHLGIRLNSITFPLNPSGPCVVSVEAMGIDATQSTTPVDATLTDTGAVPFSGFDATILENGIEIGEVKSGSIKVTNNLDGGQYSFGSKGKRRLMPEGFMEVSGSLVVFFENDVLMKKALSGTTSNLKVTYSRGNGLGTVGNESIEIFVQNLQYKPAMPEVSGQGGLEITLEFNAFKVAADLGIALTVKNAIATY